MKTQDIKRKDAAKFIDEVLLLIAKLEENMVPVRGGTSAAVQTAQLEAMRDVGNRLRTIASSHSLDIPRKCNGEAHSNPHIDNCGVCMPHWGWVQKETKVR